MALSGRGAYVTSRTVQMNCEIRKRNVKASLKAAQISRINVERYLFRDGVLKNVAKIIKIDGKVDHAP